MGRTPASVSKTGSIPEHSRAQQGNELQRVATRSRHQEVERAGLDVPILKSGSVYRMIELGVFNSPGIVIDGKVAIAGRIPNQEEIRKLLNLVERQAV